MKSSKLGFHAVLAASGRAPEIPESADAYGWLVGDWELDVFHYWATNVASRGIKGEVHADWLSRRSSRSGRLDHCPRVRTVCQNWTRE